MKMKKSDKKPVTISEASGAPKGAFAHFLKEKQVVLGKMKSDADQRARKCTDGHMVWAA